MNRLWKIVPALLAAGLVGFAYAKLPAAPADPAKAEEAKKNAAEAAKKDADALEKAMDRVVERYKREKGIKTSAAAAPEKKKK